MISRVTRDIRRIDWPRVALIAAIVTTTVFLFREGEAAYAAQTIAAAAYPVSRSDQMIIARPSVRR